MFQFTVCSQMLFTLPYYYYYYYPYIITIWQYWCLNSGPHTWYRQALYHLSHVPSPFALALFQVRSCAFCPGWPWTMLCVPVPPMWL
jgi:hypothetical protein